MQSAYPESVQFLQPTRLSPEPQNQATQTEGHAASIQNRVRPRDGSGADGTGAKHASLGPLPTDLPRRNHRCPCLTRDQQRPRSRRCHVVSLLPFVRCKEINEVIIQTEAVSYTLADTRVRISLHSLVPGVRVERPAPASDGQLRPPPPAAVRPHASDLTSPRVRVRGA